MIARAGRVAEALGQRLLVQPLNVLNRLAGHDLVGGHREAAARLVALGTLDVDQGKHRPLGAVVKVDEVGLLIGTVITSDPAFVGLLATATAELLFAASLE